MTYWTWWLGAIALASVTVGFSLVRKQPLGVSGSWARIILRNYDKAIEQAELPFREKPEMLKDALMKATIEEFGEQEVLNALNSGQHKTATTTVLSVMPIRIAWTAHLTFLLMLIVGGTIAATVKGNFEITFNLGALHQQYFGFGFGYWLILFTGGTMVGFGTQMGGGCTSGHALSGCPRFVSASLIATGSFFASAVLISLLIRNFGGG